MKTKEKSQILEKNNSEKKYKSLANVNNKSNASVIEAKKQGDYKCKTKVNNKCITSARQEKKNYKSNANVKTQEKEEDYKHLANASDGKSLEIYGEDKKLPIKAEEFVEFFEMKARIKEMLSWYETKQKNVIELPELKIDKRILKGEAVVKTYRVNSIAVKEFEGLCEKYKEFTTQNLLSQAIIEFVERYRKH